jgi:hypothetical protein
MKGNPKWGKRGGVGASREADGKSGEEEEMVQKLVVDNTSSDSNVFSNPTSSSSRMLLSPIWRQKQSVLLTNANPSSSNESDEKAPRHLNQHLQLEDELEFMSVD